jgi:hypothetical protein
MARRQCQCVIMDNTTDVQTSMILEEEEEEAALLSPLSLRKHLRIVMWTGFILLLITCTSVFIVVFSRAGVVRLPVDYEVKIDYTDSNQTSCIYFERYSYLENEYTVCQTNGPPLYISINVNGSMTVLELHQWLTHKRLAPIIDSSLNKAKDYWENYKGRVRK